MHSLKIALGAMCLAAAALPAQAQDVGGKYTVAGKAFDGSPYTGLAQIAPNGSTCVIVWQTADAMSEGICMLSKKTLAAFYKLDATFGLIIYDLRPDGSLAGEWTMVDKAGRGTEVLTPAK